MTYFSVTVPNDILLHISSTHLLETTYTVDSKINHCCPNDRRVRLRCICGQMSLILIVVLAEMVDVSCTHATWQLYDEFHESTSVPFRGGHIKFLNCRSPKYKNGTIITKDELEIPDNGMFGDEIECAPGETMESVRFGSMQRFTQSSSSGCPHLMTDWDQNHYTTSFRCPSVSSKQYVYYPCFNSPQPSEIIETAASSECNIFEAYYSGDTTSGPYPVTHFVNNYSTCVSGKEYLRQAFQYSTAKIQNEVIKAGTLVLLDSNDGYVLHVCHQASFLNITCSYIVKHGSTLRHHSSIQEAQTVHLDLKHALTSGCITRVDCKHVDADSQLFTATYFLVASKEVHVFCTGDYYTLPHWFDSKRTFDLQYPVQKTTFNFNLCFPEKRIMQFVTTATCPQRSLLMQKTANISPSSLHSSSQHGTPNPTKSDKQQVTVSPSGPAVDYVMVAFLALGWTLVCCYCSFCCCICTIFCLLAESARQKEGVKARRSSETKTARGFHEKGKSRGNCDGLSPDEIESETVDDLESPTPFPPPSPLSTDPS